MLDKLLLIELDDELLNTAGMLDAPAARTLDAIHLAAAKALAPELGVVITHDERMTRAAGALGFPISAPA